MQNGFPPRPPGFGPGGPPYPQPQPQPQPHPQAHPHPYPQQAPYPQAYAPAPMPPHGPPPFAQQAMHAPAQAPSNVAFRDLPPPRPFPPGAASHPGDTVRIVWLVIFGFLSMSASYYATSIAYHSDEQAGGGLAAFVFFVFGALVLWRWLAARGRRQRLLVFGRAVEGAVLEKTHVTVRTQRSRAVVGTYYRIKVAFEDKEVTFDHTLGASDNPTLFVEGRFAALYRPGFQTSSAISPPRVDYAKWRPRAR